MNTFTVEGGHFRLNGRPLFLQAGEFHYFRTPAEQWAHRLGLLREAGFNAVASYIPWLWHQPEPGISDVDGHTHPMRDLAGFLDLAAEMGFHIVARPGPYIMAETINEGIPPWVFAQHPQAAFVGQDGAAQNVVSYLHPDFLRCVEAWVQTVFKVLSPRQTKHGGRIALIQLDNEMGMIQWVRNLVDTNPDTLARFAAWLTAAYGDDLPARYPAGDLTVFLRNQIVHPDAHAGGRVVEDYRRFYRGYLREYTAWLWDCARRNGMTAPPVINIHGFGNGGKTFPIGLSQLADVMAMDGVVSATDVYPIFIGEGNYHQLLLVNEMTKSLQNRQQPLFSIEFQAGGNQDFGGAQASLNDLHSRLCISGGMRAINHYLFFDGENDPVLSPTRRHDWGHPVRKDGTLRRHFARYPKLSRVLAAYGDALVESQPETVTTIGFVLDDYMTEVNNPLTRPMTDLLTHQRDVLLFDFIARGLALTHRPFDAIELARAVLDAAQTPLLWVMMDLWCDAGVQQKLADYVQSGGRLVLVGRLPVETFDHAPCSILSDALGIRRLTADAPFTQANIRLFDDQSVPVSFVEVCVGAVDEVFATTEAGQPVGVYKHVGKGEVMWLGAALAANTLDDLNIFEQMATRMSCPPAFTVREWADVRLSAGTQGNFLFVSNYQDDPIETVITRDGVPLFGGHAVALAARRGAILPLEWCVKPGLTVHWLTSEVTSVTETDGTVTLTTDLVECRAEISLLGWQCADPVPIGQAGGGRFVLRVTNGRIVLRQK